MTPEREKEIREALVACEMYTAWDSAFGKESGPEPSDRQKDIAVNIDDELEEWLRDLIGALDEEREKVRKLKEENDAWSARARMRQEEER